MALVFNPEYTLTRQNNTIILHPVRLIGGNKFLESISSLDAFILALYDGQRTTSDICELLSDANLGYVTDAVKKTTARFTGMNILIELKNLPSNSGYQNLHPQNFIFDAEVKPRGAHFDKPIGINYIATHRCHLNCRYCYAGATADYEEKLMPIHRILEIIDEAAELQISTINISGGEPFQHPQMVQIIEYIIKKNIYPVISTKAHLEVDTVRRIASSGLVDIQVSLDSPEPKITDNLAGKKGHHVRLLETIKLLVNNGIDVSVNSVITSLNINLIPSLADIVSGLGVSKLYLSPYMTSLGRHDDRLIPSKSDIEWINSILPSLQDRYPYLLISSGLGGAPLSSDKEKINACEKLMPSGNMYCGIGVYGFVLLPNGKVTVCERITDRDELVMGDLNSESIMKMWGSAKWENICVPDRGIYSGTECGTCDDFGECTMRRKRCLAQTLVAFGRLFGPDPTCPHVSFRSSG